MGLPVHCYPFKAIYLIGFFVVLLFMHLLCWLIYYSWRPNGPEKSWTVRPLIGSPAERIGSAPELVAKHAARTGTESIAIPVYWILKEGTKWSPEYDKAQKDEKVVLYFHGSGFWSVSFLLCIPSLCQLLFLRWELPTQHRTFFRTAEPIPSCGLRRDRRRWTSQPISLPMQFTIILYSVGTSLSKRNHLSSAPLSWTGVRVVVEQPLKSRYL